MQRILRVAPNLQLIGAASRDVHNKTIFKLSITLIIADFYTTKNVLLISISSLILFGKYFIN